MSLEITPDQIRNYGIDADTELIEQIISDAIDQAQTICPTLPTLPEPQATGVAAVIRVAVVRYIETANNGSEGLVSTQDTAGAFSTSSTFRTRTTIFLPSEERKIRQADQAARNQVQTIDLAPEAKPALSWSATLFAAQTGNANKISAINERIFRHDLDSH